MKIKLTMRLFRNYPLLKRACIIAVVAASAISIIGFCAIVFSGSHIEDVNGLQDTKLAVLTIDDILSDGHSSTTFASSTAYSGSKTNVSGNCTNMTMIRSLSVQRRLAESRCCTQPRSILTE